MDPINIISFGLTVFKKINEIRKDVKAAPEQLESLQVLSEGIEIIFMRLQKMRPHMQLIEAKELAFLKKLDENVHHHLEQVNRFVEQVQGKASDSGRKRRVKIIAWIMGKDDFDNISRTLRDLQGTLDTMMSVIVS